MLLIEHLDCFAAMSQFEDSSVNLIISDWPYYKVKKADWDRQWKTVDEYLEWIGRVCAEYQRILAPNGSLYAFASPEMADRISVKIREFLNVLNHIVWRKEQDRGKHAAACKEILRGYFPNTERIIFAEHYGADNAAKGESGYGVKCDELRGFVFEPLRAYLDGERLRANISQRQVIAHLGMTGHDPHFFKAIQWKLPLKHQYEAMYELFNQNDGHEYLQAEYEDLRAEYEDLRAEYEDLRRPFNLTAQDQYTDVWEFPTVKAYPGKHPCEKPLVMYEHIVRVSSGPDDLVADFFCGSGVTAEAAVNLGRRFYCSDFLQKHVEATKERVAKMGEPELQQLSFSVQTERQAVAG